MPPLPSMILTFVIAIGFALEKFAANPSRAMQTYRQISFAVNSRIDDRSLCMILSLYDFVLARPNGEGTNAGQIACAMIATYCACNEPWFFYFCRISILIYRFAIVAK
jgi:hypothetical protein